MVSTISRAATAALAVLLACAMIFPGAAAEKVYKQTFRSPAFTLGPGDVISKYLTVDMPEGHIAIRSFNTQVVDEDGVPVPLHETYLHHWVLLRYYVPRSTGGVRERVLASNSGVCSNGDLRQLFGLGSETRRTNTEIPPPYGIEVGDSEIVPPGYDVAWILNVHAIDTRGAVDVRGCTECVCDLYNVTKDPSGKHGRPIAADYEGGLECCSDATHCAVRPEFEGPERVLFMEYYVTWVDMSAEVVPVKVYILDVTDGRTAVNSDDTCKVEYTVHKCLEGESNCLDKEENVNFLPTGGNIIYAVAHQHSGGIGSTLYNEDGTEICTSLPTYGNGSEPGNEVGYIVGMSTCKPEPGTVKVRGGEKLRFVSWYNNEKRHTGVMGLFYLLIDESQSPPPLKGYSYENWILAALTITAAVILIGVIVSHQLKTIRGGPEYERMV